MSAALPAGLMSPDPCALLVPYVKLSFFFSRESVSVTDGIRDHGWHRRMVEGSRWCHRHRHHVVRAWRWNGPFVAPGTRASAFPIRSLHHKGATRPRESQSQLLMVFEITDDTGAWLRAATGAIGTGTVWCVLGSGMVRLEHRGHVQARH